MDPNATLFEIRELVRYLQNVPGESLPQENINRELASDKLVDRVAALDEWLSKGGMPPKDWRMWP